MVDPVTKVPLSPGQRHRLDGLAEQRAQVEAKIGRAAVVISQRQDEIVEGRKALALIEQDVGRIHQAAIDEAKAAGTPLAKGVWAHVGADLIMVQAAPAATVELDREKSPL